MNRDEAIAIRSSQLAGEPVSAIRLQEAIQMLQSRRIGRPYKYKLPDLPRPVRERVNAMLLFNLGLAIGRVRA